VVEYNFTGSLLPPTSGFSKRSKLQIKWNILYRKDRKDNRNNMPVVVVMLLSWPGHRWNAQEDEDM